MKNELARTVPFRLPWKVDKSKYCIRDADDNYLIEDSDISLLEFIVTTINFVEGVEYAPTGQEGDMAKFVTTKIKDLLQVAYPKLSDYHISEAIEQMVKYFQSVNDSENRINWLAYREYTRVRDWEDIRNQIIIDIVERKDSWFDKKEHWNKNDFERGALAAIALIVHRIDCITD